MTIDPIAQAYIELAHGIEQHNPGYIDGYYGPEALKPNTTRPLAELAHEAEQLGAAVATLPEADRREFLAGQVRAMQTTIGLLQGEPIRYAEEVRRLYDIEPTRVPETQFDEALAALHELLPGDGPIAEREQALRAQFEVPAERMRPLIDTIVSELEKRTRALFGLPEDEAFDVEFVQNQPWSGYNWYLGNNRSRIDINTDLPTYVTDLPNLLAHEAYPGHHTEHAIKDELLYRAQGRGEHSILLINAPECVVSEGIATRALDILMSDDEVHDWLANDLLARAGLEGTDLDRLLTVVKVKRKLGGVAENAALLLNEDGASQAETIAYLQRYRLAKPEEARKSIEFFTHPNFRSYIFTYTRGGQLLDDLFATSDAHTWFGRLLREPATPGGIRRWTAEGKSGGAQ